MIAGASWTVRSLPSARAVVPLSRLPCPIVSVGIPPRLAFAPSLPPDTKRRRALQLLASCDSEGCTEALMRAHDFMIEQMVELVPSQLATASPEASKLPGKRILAPLRRRRCDLDPAERQSQVAITFERAPVAADDAGNDDQLIVCCREIDPNPLPSVRTPLDSLV